MAHIDRSEAAEYYFHYIDQVAGDDICAVLEAQLPEVTRLFQTVSNERSRYRYGLDKWSIREVVGHLSDTERLFVFRAFWFARGFDTPLPSFDQNVAMAASAAHDRSWEGLIDEFSAVRLATLSFFRTLPEDAWSRRGVASGNPFSVRALAYLAAGHVRHHTTILQQRYLTAS